MKKESSKRFLALMLAIMLLISLTFVSCKKEEEPEQEKPTVVETTKPADETPVPENNSALEEVKGVTIPAFELFINGVSVTQDTMAAYPVYSVAATSVNSTGTESTSIYIGFSFLDLLDAAGLKEQYVWLQVVADDGYAVTLTGAEVMEETNMIAMTKDGSPYAVAPWFAPCSNPVTGNYLKNAVSILLNTVESAPDMSHTMSSNDAQDAEGLPEIQYRTDKVEFAPYCFKINGQDVTNETLEGLRIYKIAPIVTNNKGETEERNYTGYNLMDVLNAVGVGDATNVKAVANDGFESVLTEEMINSEYTLIAIEFEKEVGEDGTVWIAPCAQTTAGSYVKLVVNIIVE
ncbi:MAG: hypothetical protein FWG21_05410 [Oscillospiraceae bacterium]|nr:hypothetical protein [Oscillospiraceae bacterium]